MKKKKLFKLLNFLKIVKNNDFNKIVKNSQKWLKIAKIAKNG